MEHWVERAHRTGLNPTVVMGCSLASAMREVTPNTRSPDAGCVNPEGYRWGMAAGAPFFIAGSALCGTYAGQPLGLCPSLANITILLGPE